MDWLVGDVNKDGLMEIAQLQNNGGWLGILAYGWENGAIITIPYGYKIWGRARGRSMAHWRYKWPAVDADSKALGRLK